MALMRAKMKVGSVFPNRNADGVTVSEHVNFHGVARSSPYPADGVDEDNSFARWTPSISLQMSIANPDLFGKLVPGDAYYVDFTAVA